MSTDPKKLLRFIELAEFASQRVKLGITDEDLLRLQRMLIENPETGDVIKGAGGFRKVRLADPRSNRGKSGSYRVIYLLIHDSGIIFLGTVYGKLEKPNLSPAEAKAMSVAASLLKDQVERGIIR
jgi:hypothetical protein